MSPAPLRILGLDPGLRRTGWGVIRVEGNRLSHLGHGVIAPDEKAPFSERLLALFEGISAVVAEWSPDEAAIEETFMNNNAASALKLGHARAAAMLAPARAGLPVAERAARLTVFARGGHYRDCNSECIRSRVNQEKNGLQSHS